MWTCAFVRSRTHTRSRPFNDCAAYKMLELDTEWFFIAHWNSLAIKHHDSATINCALFTCSCSSIKLASMAMCNTSVIHMASIGVEIFRLFFSLFGRDFLLYINLTKVVCFTCDASAWITILTMAHFFAPCYRIFCTMFGDQLLLDVSKIAAESMKIAKSCDSIRCVCVCAVIEFLCDVREKLSNQHSNAI